MVPITDANNFLIKTIVLVYNVAYRKNNLDSWSANSKTPAEEAWGVVKGYYQFF